MDDGIFQLLFFGVLILASVFDAMTRGRRRRRRMEKMEREEEVEERVEPVGTAERETADSMVPSDLWAILTGEQPAPGSESPQTPAPGPSAEPDPQREAERVPQSDVILEPPSHVEPEWLPEFGEASKPEPVPELSLPQSRQAPLRVPDRSYPSTEAPPVEAAPSAIGVSKRSHTPMPGLIGVAGARRPGGAAVYAELLRGGGADSLRRAIVLTEVLGEPASLRPPGWGWEER